MNSENLCSMNTCPKTAVHAETAETPHWTVMIFYCAEHYREIELGTPLGPLGVDPCRVAVEPVGRKELLTPRMQAGAD